MTILDKPSEPLSPQGVPGGIFACVFKNTPTIQLIIDLEHGKIVEANAAAEAFYGWPREKLQSMRIHDINTRASADIDALLKATHPSPGHTFQFHHRLASGEIKAVEVSITAMDGVGPPLCLSIIHDITNRKQAEDRILLCQRAMDASSNGLTIADAGQADMPFIYANPAFLKMTGYSLDEIKGHNCRFLQGSDRNQKEADQLREAIKQGKHCEVVLRNYRKDGTLFWNEVIVSPVRDASGQITHYIGSQKDVSERKKAEGDIEQLAYFDPLTALPNRRLFLDRLAMNVAFAQRTKTCGAVALIDLDHFKHLNEAEGHERGDQLLREVARRININLRPGDTGARLGGDEFVVLLTNLAADPVAAAQLARVIVEGLFEAICEPAILGGLTHQSAASIGVVIFPQEKDSPLGLLQQADTAMYRAKESGRNAICFFEPAMQATAQVRLTIERDLRLALERGELRMYLQPQVNRTAAIIGVEALMRWEHPHNGLVAPAAFIPVAEETGLIVAMGEWIFAQACILATQLAEKGSNIRIAVNVSPRQFRDPNFLGYISQTMKETGASPSLLVLEITEAVIFDNFAEAMVKMNQIKAMGIHLSLDDFGTGYSSLAYLQKLPFSEIKIDRSFITDAPNNAHDAALVEAILALARPNNLQVVAEGVETQQHVDFLKGHSCPIFQGYFYGRPMPRDEFIAMMQKQKLISSK